MSDRQSRLGRWFAIVLVAMLAAVMPVAGTAWAARGGNPGPSDRGFDPASNTEGNHCTTPTGVDLNQFYGISEQIVAFFCTQVDVGEFWTPTVLWIMDFGFTAVPAGFVPAGATPLDDFLAKFVAVKYVVDPGTPQARTYVYQKSSKLWTGIAGGLPAVNTLTLSRLQPLPPGQHVVEVYWVLSGLHCDGLAADLANNCIPAGETLFARTTLQVTAPAPQSNP